MLMIDDLGEQRHQLDSGGTGRVRVPSLASQVLALRGSAPEQCHGQNEMHMHSCLPSSSVRVLFVKHEEAVKLVWLEA
jgi:hypothetical protein